MPDRSWMNSGATSVQNWYMPQIGNLGGGMAPGGGGGRPRSGGGAQLMAGGGSMTSNLNGPPMNLPMYSMYSPWIQPGSYVYQTSGMNPGGFGQQGGAAMSGWGPNGGPIATSLYGHTYPAMYAPQNTGFDPVARMQSRINGLAQYGQQPGNVYAALGMQQPQQQLMSLMMAQPQRPVNMAWNQQRMQGMQPQTINMQRVGSGWQASRRPGAAEVGA